MDSLVRAGLLFIVFLLAWIAFDLRGIKAELQAEVWHQGSHQVLERLSHRP